MSMRFMRPRLCSRPSTVLILLLLSAIALRAYHLDFQSLWSDEGISLLRASLPLPQMLREMPVEHAPGYFVLLHLWIQLVGTSDFSLRFLSLWPSVLAVALAYRLAADLGRQRAGLITAALLACNPFQVWYAQEARMYSWLLAAGLASTWFLWRLTSSASPRLPMIGYIIATAGAIYLHHYGFLVPIVHAGFMAWRLWRCRDLAAVRRWVVVSIVILLLYLPWLPRAIRVFSFPGWRSPGDPWQIPWRYLTAYTVGDPMPAPWQAWLPPVYLILIVIGALTWWRHKPAAGALLLASTLLPLIVVLALALRKADFHERYAIIISGPLVILAAGGIDGLRRVRLGMAALLLAGLITASGLALFHLYTDETLHKPNFRAAAARIQTLEKPGDVILVDGPDPRKVFLHYYHGNAPVYDLRDLQDAEADEINATLIEATRRAHRAWELLYFHQPGPIQVWLATHAWPAAETMHNGIRVTLYGLPGIPSRSRELDLRFGPSLRLTEVEIGGETSPTGDLKVEVGELLRITTRWQVEAKLPDYKFSLRLYDLPGRLWLSEDYVPQNWLAPTSAWIPGQPATDRHGLLLPWDLPPGPYRITMRLYDVTTEQPIETEEGIDVPLAEIQVYPAASPPPAEAIFIPSPVNQPAGKSLILRGYGVSPDPLRPSHPGELSLWWQILHPLEGGPQLRIRLLDAGGAIWAEGTYPLTLGIQEWWRPGQITRERYLLRLDPAVKTGRYRLELALIDEAGREPVLLSIGDIRVQARPRRYRLWHVPNKVGAYLGEGIILRGYKLAPKRPTAGASMKVTLYWQALARVDGHYKVFVHLYDETGQLRTQVDDFPLHGDAPTESWLPGEVLIDRYTLHLPADLPAATYRLAVGMYDPVTGRRLPATDAKGTPLPNNAIPLREIQLR